MPTTSLSSRTGRCASTGRDVRSRLTPTRTSPGCYAWLWRRSPYEKAAADLALHAEHGPLRALALSAPRGVVEPDEPVVAAAGADRPRLFRHAHREGAPAWRHHRAAGAAEPPRRRARGPVAGGRFRRDHLPVHDER